jgi:hypothetical protein
MVKRLSTNGPGRNSDPKIVAAMEQQNHAS